MGKKYNHHSSASGPTRRRNLVVKRDRMQRLAQMVTERPDMTQTDIAARFGCSQPTVSLYLSELFADWLSDDKQQVQHVFLLAIKRQERVFALAIDGYQRSQQNVERVTTAYVPRQCPVCKGAELKSKKTCKACDGTGKVLEEHVTKQLTGQAGDSSFLNTATNALRQLAKLQGLHRKELNVFLQSSGGESVAGETRVDWSRVTPDELIAVRRMMTRATLPPERGINLDTTFTEEK